MSLKPLPFDVAKLKGLSERLIGSHWLNNYAGSVRALNETNRRLSGAMTDPELPAFVYNDMKREHLMRTGSVVLDRNPFEVDPMELSKIEVLKTMMNGRFTYQAGPEGPQHEEDHPYPGDYERLVY